MSDDESHAQPVDENEAKRAMEEAAQRKAEKVAQEIAEFEEQRKHEREKEQEEIRQLREKREQRKREREEEEKRLTGMRAQEEARRKSEEEERRRKKLEEEAKRKEERERKRREQEERIKNMRKPNFVITKKSGDNAVDEKEKADVSKEEVQKSKEQLEEEKRAILAQRIKPLPDLNGCDTGKLTEQAKELHKEIHRLMSEKYDLEQKFKRQQYDMIELAERARQMSKGKSRRGVSSAQVDESFDRLADKFAGAPPKIQLCSKYERHTDHRTYGQRLVLFEELSKPLESPKVGRKHGGEEEGGETAQAEEEE